MSREGCQNWPLSGNLGVALPIVTKSGVCLEQVAMPITQVMYGVYLHVFTCTRADVPPFTCLRSGCTGRIALKFGAWLESRDPLARRFTKVEGGMQ